MNNLITVIVPIYNAELYLEKCLESLVCQTVAFDEIILINDGSTDESSSICDKYCGTYEYFKLVKQENKGQGTARNRGIWQAKGDYILFVDSDDYVDLRLCERVQRILEQKDLDVLYYNAEVQYDIRTEEAANAFKHLDSLNGRIITGMEYFNISFPGAYTVSIWNAAYKRCFLEKYNILFPEGIYFEDYYFYLQVITNAEKVMCISDSLYIRRCRENSITTGEMDRKKCCDLVENQRLLGNYLSCNQKWLSKPDLLRKFVAQMTLNTFYNISKCPDLSIINEQKEILTKIFLQRWLFLFLEPEYKWDESLLLLLIMRELEILKESSKDAQVIEKFYGTMSRFDEYRKEAESVLRSYLLQNLSRIPMNKKGVKIGIYGIGRHTANLMELYEQWLGKIECELIFIVTSCKKEMSYCNRTVISCCEIPENIDCILLSSMPYQNEMKKNLLCYGIDTDKIVTLYEEGDICDLIKVNWVLHEIKKSRC